MKLQHFFPVVGVPLALTDIYYSDEPFSVKCQQAALVGATQAAFVSFGMNKNYFSAIKAVRTVQLATNPVAATVVVGAASVLATKELVDTFVQTETARDPWWLAFVSGLTDF